MELIRRAMWPKLGEHIEVYTDGELTLQGVVTFVNDTSIMVSNKDMLTVTLDTDELMSAIKARTTVIKKRENSVHVQ